MPVGCEADGETLIEFTLRRHPSSHGALRASHAGCTAACSPTASRFDTIPRVPR
jgi:hypothetical protein